MPGTTDCTWGRPGSLWGEDLGEKPQEGQLSKQSTRHTGRQGLGPEVQGDWASGLSGPPRPLQAHSGSRLGGLGIMLGRDPLDRCAGLRTPRDVQG